MVKESMTPRERQCTSEILYVDYMSSEESEYEDQEDFVTGEKQKKLTQYVTKRLPWQRTALTNIKAKLDRIHRNNLTPHARATVGCKKRHCYRLISLVVNIVPLLSLAFLVFYLMLLYRCLYFNFVFDARVLFSFYKFRQLNYKACSISKYM